jgi:hypothetical protein
MRQPRDETALRLRVQIRHLDRVGRLEEWLAGLAEAEQQQALLIRADSGFDIRVHPAYWQRLRAEQIEARQAFRAAHLPKDQDWPASAGDL